MRNLKRSSKVGFNLSKGLITDLHKMLHVVLAPPLSISFFKDPDTLDEEPSDYLIDYYKCEQLRNLMFKVYNTDDVKFLYLKLVKAQRATMPVSF